ncbi:hypothetical protein [Mucilaginibacter dorajii]|uniref:DoxX family protein n=1 Tax=Mucilaginibacter dorajii TaxID=692994 RepID=A0ABP7P103_9SPHI|nr:hypothetical protein [Mucilaginibacter dorajii]MCS3735551.1 hypothetical protein [Mucilaginibacter dorajii]
MTTINATEPVYWSGIQKLALRFFLVFFIVYIILDPNGFLPYADPLFNLFINPFHTFIPWLAKNVLHMAKPITDFTGGSGDTTYDYLVLLFVAILSAVSAVIWSVIDRKARNYNKLFYWVCVIVRYYVALTMLSYGFIKIIKLQFGSPTPGRLLESFGDASPMGLAWTYMGYSTGFNYFTGIAEVSCGLLLFFRKTTTLGAVLGVVVAGNIMAINYCFDVPVKLLSTMLVAMSIFLLSKDALRLFNFFFFNKSAPPSNIDPHRFKARWKNITLNTIKYVLIVYVIGINLKGDIEAATQYGDKAPKPPLYGIYDVQSFVRNKDTIAPLTTDTTRWRKLIISYAANARIKLMNDTLKNYSFKIDSTTHSIVINSYTDTLKRNLFRYTEAKNGDLLLKGMWDRDSLTISLKKFDLNKFKLINRGFHWISETPYNR